LRRAVTAIIVSCSRYIERDPVEAGLVTEPWQFRWSSARAYALGDADALLAENAEYLGLADAPLRGPHLWREFLLGDDLREKVVRRGDRASGDEHFRRRALVAQGRPAPRRPLNKQIK
jgi:putative transposase